MKDRLMSVGDILRAKQKAIKSVPEYGELYKVLGEVLEKIGCEDVEGFLKEVKKETALWIKISKEERDLINSFEDSLKEWGREVDSEARSLARLTLKGLEGVAHKTVNSLRNMKFGWRWLND